MGFTRAITTPHIMNGHHKNNPGGIRARLDDLRKYLAEQQISFEVEAAAEYYFDEIFIDLVQSGQEILTFGDNYILFETNTFSEPLMLDDLIFRLKVKNYRPVMAHPERYQYLQNNFARVEDLINRGVYMQINSLSLMGFYSRPIQRAAHLLVEAGMIHFLGSDCHTPDQALKLKRGLSHKYFKKALELPLLNYSL